MATHELIKGMDALDDAEALVAFLAESLEGKELSEQATLGLAQVFDGNGGAGALIRFR